MAICIVLENGIQLGREVTVPFSIVDEMNNPLADGKNINLTRMHW